MRKSFVTAFTVGSATVDDVHDFPQLQTLPDGKEYAENNYEQPGGGAVNTRLSFESIAQDLMCGSRVFACIPLGKSSLQKDFLMASLKNRDFYDIAYEQEYSVPKNRITVWGGNFGHVKRFIAKIKVKKDEIADVDLKASPIVWGEVEDAVQKSDVLILHSRFPDVALHAAQASRRNEHTTPVILDYSGIKPDEHNVVVRDLIKNADYILLPSDALLPGMEESNKEELKRRLVDDYGIKYFAISDGDNPIEYYADGEYSQFTLPHVVEKDNLGCGDVRDAAFGFFISQGEEFVPALKKASYVASLAASHYGREWMPHLLDFMAEYPEIFADALPTNYQNFEAPGLSLSN